MRKPFTIIKGVIIWMAAVYLGLTASATNPECLYYVTWDGSTNGCPVVENEPFFPKLVQTAPESGVYVGNVVFNPLHNWFRFYSELQDCPAYAPEMSWKKGNVAPGKDTSVLTPLGKSGVFMAYDVHDYKNMGPFEEPGTWYTSQEGPHKVTVDLNKGTMELLPMNALFVLVNDTRTPDLEHPENYVTIGNFNQYVPEGDFDIYFYSPFKKQWACWDRSEHKLYEGATSLDSWNLQYSDDISEAGPFNYYGKMNGLRHWPGGMMNGISYETEFGWAVNTMKISTDKPSNSDLTTPYVYLVGDFSNWDFKEDYRFPPSDSAHNRFEIKIPAGTQEFKITTEDQWGFNFGNSGNVYKAGDNGIVVELKEDGSNIVFEHPLESSLQVFVNLRDYTLTLPSTAPIAITRPSTSGPNDGSLYIMHRDYDLELWDQAPISLINTFTRLPKIGENQWLGTMELNNSGTTNFRLISKATTKGEPNMVLSPEGGKDRNLYFVNGFAYSSATETSENQAGYWVINDSEGQKVSVKVTLNEGKYEVEVDDASQSKIGQIYLVGSPQGWDINSDAMALRITETGGYYGHFNISKGEAMFRFYSELGNWDSNSIGSQYDDMPIDVEMSINDEPIIYEYVSGGKGSWNFYDWEGGDMYILVDPSTRSVAFSRNPIANAGEIVESPVRTPVEEGVFAGRIPFYAAEDGLYDLNWGPVNDNQEIRLFSKLLPISEDEAAYPGSYTIAPIGDGIVDLSKSPFAEFDLVTNNTIGTAPATPLKFINVPENSRINLTVDLNNKKIYVADFSGYFVLPHGTLMPTASTASRYYDRYVPANGGIVDIPAGEFDVWFAGLYTKVEPDETVTISMATDPFVVDNQTDFNYGWGLKRLSCPDWNGGKVFLNATMACDVTALESIKVYADNDVFTLIQDPKGSMQFKGEVEFKSLDDTQYGTVHSMNAELARKDVIREFNGQEYSTTITLTSGATVFPYGIGNVIDPTDRYLLIKNGVASGKTGFNGYSLLLPNVTEGIFETIFDFADQTVNIMQTEGKSANLYETVAGEESVLDGATSYAATGVEDASVIDIPSIGANEYGYEFNLAGSQGVIVAPQTDTEIIFDATGTWTGSYDVVEVPGVRGEDSEIKARVRRAAGNEAKWHFSVPESHSTNISILVNEGTRTVTIFSEAHNVQGFFIVSSREKNGITMSNLEKAKENMLTMVADGVYKGKFNMNGTDNMDNIIFQKGVNGLNFTPGGIYYDSFDPMGWMLDITEEGECTKNAWDIYESNGMIQSYPAYSWMISGLPAVYDITYDSKAHTLSVKAGESLVESIAKVPAESLEIIPGYGGLTILSGEEVSVNIYNLNGILVRTIDATAGATTVELPAGIYIAAGKKLVVK